MAWITKFRPKCKYLGVISVMTSIQILDLWTVRCWDGFDYSNKYVFVSDGIWVSFLLLHSQLCCCLLWPICYKIIACSLFEHSICFRFCYIHTQNQLFLISCKVCFLIAEALLLLVLNPKVPEDSRWLLFGYISLSFWHIQQIRMEIIRHRFAQRVFTLSC